VRLWRRVALRALRFYGEKFERYPRPTPVMDKPARKPSGPPPQGKPWPEPAYHPNRDCPCPICAVEKTSAIDTERLWWVMQAQFERGRTPECSAPSKDDARRIAAAWITPALTEERGS
jgi:hypothetical protein